MNDEARNYGRDIIREALLNMREEHLVAPWNVDAVADQVAEWLHENNLMLCPLEYQP